MKMYEKDFRDAKPIQKGEDVAGYITRMRLAWAKTRGTASDQLPERCYLEKLLDKLPEKLSPVLSEITKLKMQKDSDVKTETVEDFLINYAAQIGFNNLIEKEVYHQKIKSNENKIAAISEDKNKVYCFDFANKGKCTREGCKFKHIQQCKNFPNGTCKFGDKCRFIHKTTTPKKGKKDDSTVGTIDKLNDNKNESFCESNEANLARISDDEFLIDSGADDNFCKTTKELTNVIKINGSVRSASGTTSDIIARGMINIAGKQIPALHVPNFGKNLMSVALLCDTFEQVVFNSKNCTVFGKDKKAICVGRRIGNLYSMKLQQTRNALNHEQRPLITVNHKADDDLMHRKFLRSSEEYWHSTFGHVGSLKLKRTLLSYKIRFDEKKLADICNNCIICAMSKSNSSAPGSDFEEKLPNTLAKNTIS
jgi:hypothetical protein